MGEATENRQARIDVLAKADNFDVSVQLNIGIGDESVLTHAEYWRLGPKLQLVERIAARLAANMLKGTLKYDNDEYTLREWLEMGLDDAVDSVNYQTLALVKLDELEADMTGGLEEYSSLFGKAKRQDGSGA